MSEPVTIDLSTISSAQFAQDLRHALRGEVRFDAGSRALYATDASNYRQVPIGVVVPETVDDVRAAIRIAREHGAPIVNRGGGTSIAGQGCNTALLIDYSKYLREIIEIDADAKLAVVQPGVVLDDLRQAAEVHHLTFGPDPATHAWCTLGGMIGNNSCGVHSIMSGRTVDNIHSMKILTYDGTEMTVGPTSDAEYERIQSEGGRHAEIYRQLRELVSRHAAAIRTGYPNLPRRVSGYNLQDLLPENGFNVARALVGSESTLVTVLEATVKLVHSPKERVLLVAGFTDIATAADYVPKLLEFGPIGLEGMDALFMHDMRIKQLMLDKVALLPNGNGWLLIEFGEDVQADAIRRANDAAHYLEQSGAIMGQRLFVDAKEQHSIWRVRDSGLGATAHVPDQKDNWEGWEDAAVPPARIGAYLRDFQALMARYEYIGALYGHFGDGCIHLRLDWDNKSRAGIDKWLRFVNDAADLVVSYGGSLSGEHGDGQSRAALLPKMFSPELIRAFEEFKTIWDPTNRMNPGKVVHPYAIDENLRYGTDYNPPDVKTWFQYPEDRNSFARATERCVSASLCRRDEGGVMCPTYKATHEELHSTRGRAHMLWEMMKGNPVAGGWQNEAVHEALDLCLACKGCKGECPVHVDMATYKAEYLAHYYEHRPRPRAAHTMGRIADAARIASKFPRLTNFLTHFPIASTIAKLVADIHPARTIPRFATTPFTSWFFARKSAAATDGNLEVVLWADTFNNFFHAETAKHATEVLEDAGFRVRVYRETMCCGRPLYDWGMLDRAKAQLKQIVATLQPDIAIGTPIVVLEPSCASVFTDELPNLLADDPDAAKLSSQVYTLGRFLATFAPAYAPRLDASILVQTHCHEESLHGHSAEETILKKMHADVQMIPPNCCGMAGAFGFETAKFEVSQAIGEHTCFPAVEKCGNDTIVMSSGFSCREQIEQRLHHKTYHLADVLHQAITQKRERAS